MRLIDADAFKEWLMKNSINEREEEESKQIGIWIDVFPSAEPRKKGKWNTYYHSDIDFSHSCNQCGYSAPYQMIGGEFFQKKWNFCPNCGSYNGGEEE